VYFNTHSSITFKKTTGCAPRGELESLNPIRVNPRQTKRAEARAAGDCHIFYTRRRRAAWISVTLKAKQISKNFRVHITSQKVDEKIIWINYRFTAPPTTLICYYLLVKFGEDQAADVAPRRQIIEEDSK
jgi:hypothetical protein